MSLFVVYCELSSNLLFTIKYESFISDSNYVVLGGLVSDSDFAIVKMI